MNKPMPAYSGNEPYVFVCYAHANADAVYPDLILLHQNGINVWYDEGIQAGKFWRAEIAGAIKSAQKLLFFISEASLKSSHCLREVDYALTHDIEIVPVYLDDTALPEELQLVLNRVQALFRKADSMYAEHLVDALSQRRVLLPYVSKKGRRQLRLGLSVAVLGVALLAVAFWAQRGSVLSGNRSVTASMVGPSAIGRYLDADGLLDRWDKDDNLEVAIEKLREVVADDPQHALAYARLADALRIKYAVSGDEAFLQEAAQQAEEAVRLNPRLAPVQVALGRVYALRGNHDLAFAALDQALAIDANYATAHQAMAQMYARLGRPDDAEASFRKAISLEPESIEHLDAYANFMYGQGRFADAAREWLKVIDLAPDHFTVLVNLGAALAESGRVAESITMYERALDIRPTYMAYANLGTALATGERYSEAIDAYQAAIRIDDIQWVAWGNLAYLYAWTNADEMQVRETFEQAIQRAEAARQQNSRDLFAHAYLALYYSRTGQSELALQRLATTMALAEDSADVLAAAAEVYENLGERDRAVEFALRAIDLGLPRLRLERNPELDDLMSDPRME